MIVWGRAAALEPTAVSATGRAEITGPADLETARDRAFDDAALEAVLQVARKLLPQPEFSAAEPRLRTELATRAKSFVLTYRIDSQRRMRGERGGADRLELSLTASVDASQVRTELRRLGLLGVAGGEGPSIALRVRGADAGQAPRDAPLQALERELSSALQRASFTVVDSDLRAATDPRTKHALELARELGADVALDVVVSFQPRKSESGVSGGVASAQVRAQRASDGFELALARFEAPGYHADTDEAQLRALEGLEPQIVQSVESQLKRNWSALEPGDGAVMISLAEVTSLLQVESVRSSLKSVLGADSAELIALGPRRATLRVETALSPGALQEKLAGLYFEGFRLEPLESGQGRVDLRVEQAREDPGGPASPRP